MNFVSFAYYVQIWGAAQTSDSGPDGFGSCGSMEEFLSVASVVGGGLVQRLGGCLAAWLFKRDISSCAQCPSEAKMFHSDRASPKSALEKIIALQQYRNLIDLCVQLHGRQEKNQLISLGAKLCRISPWGSAVATAWLCKMTPWQSKFFISFMLKSVCKRPEKILAYLNGGGNATVSYCYINSGSRKSIVLGSSIRCWHMEALCHKQLYHATVNCQFITLWGIQSGQRFSSDQPA